jgi:arylsulfatase A-like enzyme
MRKILLGVLFLVAVALPAADHTNFVFILADDLGWRDLGVYGSGFYETPNLDRLAATGMRFTNGYAACPVCSPTRASIVTGKYPVRTGVTDYIGAKHSEAWERNTRLLPAAYADRLAASETTIAEALKAAGYATFFAGKWHLGPEGSWPEDHGFDINKGGIDRGGPYGGKRYFSPYGNPRLEDGPDGEHLPERLGRETAGFIEANQDKPFLAYLAFYSVHTPLMTTAKLEAKYEAKAKLVQFAGPEWLPEHNRKTRQVQNHAVYAGMVEAMDAAVGTVLGSLDRLGLAENTVVLFMSDNGGLSTSEGHPTANLPLRAGKGWLYEGGIREPMMIRAPKLTRPGAVTDEPVTSTDFFPTMLELAGLEPAKGIDGVSLVPLLSGGDLAPRPLYWHYPHYGNQGSSPGAAIREGDWKLIEWYEDSRVELFNLAADVSEHYDLSARHPERAKAMQAKLRTWLKATNANMPVLNAKFNPDEKEGR